MTDVNSASELVDGVERVLGFTPRDSVVVVGFERQGRMGVVMRVDRRDCLIADLVREVGRAMTRQLERAGVREIAVLSFWEGPANGPGHVIRAGTREAGAQQCPALAALVPQLSASFSIREAFAVSADRRDNAPDAAAYRRVIRAMDRAAARALREPEQWGSARLAAWRAAVEEALDGRMPGDAASGGLLAGLARVHVRDAIIIDLNREFAGVADQVVEGAGDSSAHEALTGLVRHQRVADPARVEAAVDLSFHLGVLLAGRSRAGGAAAPFTVAAIGYWWLGDDCAARHCLDAALAADPEYSLANVVLATFAAGLGPRTDSWN